MNIVKCAVYRTDRARLKIHYACVIGGNVWNTHLSAIYLQIVASQRHRFDGDRNVERRFIKWHFGRIWKTNVRL